MNAREMFENLGYSLEVNSEDLIKYSKEVCGYTFFRFRLKDKEFCSGYQSIAHTTTRAELKAVIQQFKELGWIEEEKQEIKQETNYEHFKDEIIEDSGFTLALVNGKPCKCSSVNCSDCGFSTGHGCGEKIKEWLKSPYEKPTYKLTQFEYDLLQLYKGRYSFKLSNSLRGMKEKGYFKSIDENAKIEDILESCEVMD